MRNRIIIVIQIIFPKNKIGLVELKQISDSARVLLNTL
jgi:hypothetical protein